MRYTIKTILTVIIILVLTSCFSEKSQKNEIIAGWPEVTNETKPWARWWWMGSSVDKQNLSVEMEKYAKAGLGGLEITPIYGVKGLEDKFIRYTSPEWMEMLSHTLIEGKRLDLGIDMALASGWPFGGPWVAPNDACKYLEFKIFNLPEGGSLSEKVEFIQKPLVRTIGKRMSIEELKDPVATNDSLQTIAFDQVRFPRKLSIVALMGYSKEGEIIDLTDNVNKDGSLEWDAPAKEWTLIAAFTAWHGKMVERAGPGGEGDVIDHFSPEATSNYLNHFDQSFGSMDLSGLRAFFNDSYEVDDAYGESNWTPHFFTEFQKRRGYDLKEFLPALNGLSSEEEKQRVLYDYRETISDLLLDNFTIPWQKWAKSKNKKIRNQSHGSPANILDLYAASDIPETEGTNLMQIKFASSAAHISGKKLVGAEASTWLNEHFLANLADSKSNVDRYLIGGVNHIVYHGTTFSPEIEGWPGRLFYAAVNYAPSNSLWEDFPTLNTYITRVQSFLQRGTADNDILLYFPIHDQWMEPGKSSLHHFHGAENGSEMNNLALELSDKGYSFDYISDKQIANLSIENNKIITEGKAAYKTILIPKVDYIPFQTLQNLINLANKGAKIVFVNNLPDNVPGQSNLKENKIKLQKAKENLKLTSNENGIQDYGIGKGHLLVGKEVKNIFNKIELYPERLVDNDLEYIRLTDNQTKTYFITNNSANTIDRWVSFLTHGVNVVHYNPMNGEYGKAKISTSENGEQLVYLQLKPGESCLLQFWNTEISLNNYSYWKAIEPEIKLPDNWTLTFVNGGPILPEPQKNIKLDSWTNIKDENSKFFSGTAVYSTQFTQPETKNSMWELCLGEVHESARVVLNGKDLGTLIGPNYCIKFDNKILVEENNLEIYVTNLMANRIAYMDKNNLSYRNFYNVNFAARLKENQGSDGKFTALNWEPKKSGLIGPVILTALENK